MAGPEALKVALATPYGSGGIAVVLLAGEGACEALAGVFRGAGRLEPGRLVHGRLVDERGEAVDEVLVRLAAPSEFPGAAEVCEVDCHGGIACARRVVDVFRARGAVPVEGHEIGSAADLTRREALEILGAAPTSRACRFLLSAAEGALGRAVEEILGAFDDPGGAREALARLVAGAEAAGALVGGADVSILGAPNAGKSTLFNRLLEAERALVDPAPGTTRDVVVALAAVGGFPLRLADTAGIREAVHPAEVEGVSRSLARLGLPGLRVVVVSAGEPGTAVPGELATRLAGDAGTIAFVNKVDIAGRAAGERIARELPWKSVVGSARTGEGVAELARALVSRWTDLPAEAAAPFTARQNHWLGMALAALEAEDLASARAALESVLTGIGAPGK